MSAYFLCLNMLSYQWYLNMEAWYEIKPIVIACFIKSIAQWFKLLPWAISRRNVHRQETNDDQRHLA